MRSNISKTIQQKCEAIQRIQNKYHRHQNSPKFSNEKSSYTKHVPSKQQYKICRNNSIQLPDILNNKSNQQSNSNNFNQFTFKQRKIYALNFNKNTRQPHNNQTIHSNRINYSNEANKQSLQPTNSYLLFHDHRYSPQIKYNNVHANQYKLNITNTLNFHDPEPIHRKNSSNGFKESYRVSNQYEPKRKNKNKNKNTFYLDNTNKNKNPVFKSINLKNPEQQINYYQSLKKQTENHAFISPIQLIHPSQKTSILKSQQQKIHQYIRSMRDTISLSFTLSLQNRQNNPTVQNKKKYTEKYAQFLKITKRKRKEVKQIDDEQQLQCTPWGSQQDQQNSRKMQSLIRKL